MKIPQADRKHRVRAALEENRRDGGCLIQRLGSAVNGWEAAEHWGCVLGGVWFKDRNVEGRRGLTCHSSVG